MKNETKRITDRSLLAYNENLLCQLGIDLEKLKITMISNDYDYDDCSLSWHYHLFAGFGDIFEASGKSIKKILEIGTHNGIFTKFISKIYRNAEIYTIDLPNDNEIFTSSYGRQNASERETYIDVRNDNLNESNINFIEMNSTNMLEKFKNVSFDLVWVDGDHHNPQVTIDIMNSLQLLHADSIICVDDIVMGSQRTDYVSNESYLTLKNLEKNNLVKTDYVIKRTFKNQRLKKHVSVSMLSK